MEDIDTKEAPLSPQELSEEQKQRIQRNKDKALALKERRKQAKPYDRPAKVSVRASRDQPSRDSHSGFMFEEEEEATAHKHKYHRVEEEGK